MTILHLHLSNSGSSDVDNIQVDLPEEIHPTTLTYKTSIVNFYDDADFHSDANADSDNIDQLPDNLVGSIYLLLGDGGQNFIPANAINCNVGSGRLPVATCYKNSIYSHSTSDSGFVKDLNTVANYDLTFDVEKIPHSFKVVPIANDGTTRLQFGGSTNSTYPFGKIKSIDLFFDYIKDEEKH